ncbi:MoaD/ThiS family protein [Novosphingobium sp. M1R2S20]|uniref:MoaD/ThiS family protein n=1 Tax=Novosphingobium rhizovicinum TaxID=3228928 RepID=A0ABV3RD75_9SPHN
MALKLVFLGPLEDLAGAPEREVASAPSVSQVLARLEPDLAAALSSARVKCALNGAIVHDRDAEVLKSGDELAFLPPVSGG